MSPRARCHGAVRRGVWAAILSAPIAAGCIQQVDDGAASGAASIPRSPPGREGGPCPTGFISGGSDMCIPLALDTPPIQLDDGGTTSDPCSAIATQSLIIRQTYCAGCHSPPAGMGGFDFVLDDARLVTAVSSVLDDAGMPERFIIPGDPDHSRLYRRVALGEMPPTQSPPLPALPAPNVSDISVLRYWITDCLGVTPVAADDGSAGDDAAPPDDDASPGSGSPTQPTLTPDAGGQGGAPNDAPGPPTGGGPPDAGSPPPPAGGGGAGSDAGTGRGGSDAGAGRPDSGFRPPFDAGVDGSRRFIVDAGRG